MVDVVECSYKQAWNTIQETSYISLPNEYLAIVFITVSARFTNIPLFLNH